MTLAIAAILLAQGSSLDAQMTKEIRFARDLPANATWAQVKAALPKGTKFEYTGFRVDYLWIGNVVKFSGGMDGSAVLLSKAQADKYNAWKKNTKATSFPAMPASASDNVDSIRVRLGNGKLIECRSQSDYQQRMSVLKRELGDAEFGTWAEVQEYSSINVTWKLRGLEYAEDWNTDYSYGPDLIRNYSLPFKPAYEDGGMVAPTKADYTALASLMSGKRQTRLCITEGQIYDLKGWKIKPYGWKPEWWNGDQIAFITRGKEMLYVYPLLFNGKRLIQISPLAG